jgi:hypothetical protein
MGNGVWVHPNLHSNRVRNFRGPRALGSGSSRVIALEGPEIPGFGPVSRWP